MRIRQHDYISSQQTPNFMPYEHRYRKSLYSHMFLEDFSGWFSSDFLPFGMRDEFYCITPENDALKRLLQFEDYSYFGYQFDKLLSEILYYLLINGRTYVEIVSFTNHEGVIRGIAFVCIPAKHCYIRFNKCKFVAQNHNNETIHFDVDLNRVIVFDLKDLGFSRNYFRKMMNNASIFDATTDSELILDAKMNGIFDFEEYKKSNEYKLLRDMRSVHWLGRNYSNQHLSESYQLYRTMQYKKLRFKFLKYLLQQINAGLEKFKAVWGFSGKISATVSLSHYEDAFNRYSEGKINAMGLGDIVIKNLVPEEKES